MAHVSAFNAILFDPAKVPDPGIALCPPYDVISQQDQVRLYLRSPHNVIRLELGQDQPTDSREINRYTRADEQLQAWLAEGVLREDAEPALYVHVQHWEGAHGPMKRRSFHAAVRLAEWAAGEVLPHEQTLSGPKADRLLLMRNTAANMSPVFALYDDPDRVVSAVFDEAMRGEPSFVAVEPGGDKHELWRLTSWDAIAVVQEALSGRPFYIADGHHRYETALTYRDERREAQGAFSGDEPWNFVLMALSDVADPGLVVLPTHRLVRAKDLDEGAFLDKLAERFEVREIPVAGGRAGGTRQIQAALAEMPGQHRIGMALPSDESIRVLTLRGPATEALASRGRSEAWRSLDVTLLHYLVIEDMLGIPEAEWKIGKEIVYTREFKEVLLGMESAEFQVGFFLNGTPVQQIRDVAVAGDVMPQKSTFFYPKLPTGLLIHKLASAPALPSVDQVSAGSAST